MKLVLTEADLSSKAKVLVLLRVHGSSLKLSSLGNVKRWKSKNKLIETSDEKENINIMISTYREM